MRKYVAKEDVEKGLVDPTKSLEEQPEYKKKIQQQMQEKEKAYEQKHINQRPKKERPPRKQRPKFNWNKQDITQETQIPEKPKKLLQKPDAQKFRQEFDKLKAERQAIKAERGKLLDEQRNIIRDINESKRSGKAVITQYSGVMKEKFATQNQLKKEIRAIDDEKKKINAQIDALKNKADDLRKPAKNEGHSLESLKERIAEKQHQLMTSNIDKKQEAKLTNQINDLKRAVSTARPQIEIQSEISKIQDQITILFQQLKPIKKELHIKITQANEIKAELDGLKQQRKNQQGNIQETRSVQDIKAEYDTKLKALETKKDKLEQRIDDFLDKNTREKDDYEDQQDLLHYIDWVGKQIENVKARKQEDAKWQKEKQQREKKRQKEKEDYEKRQEERKKRQQQRKAKEEERKKRLEQERQRYINRNPNHQTIDLCQTLIDYCESLKPTNNTKFQGTRTREPGQLKFGKQWQKQIKGGAQVVVSKKANKQEEIKKPVKQKKKEQKPENEDFDHGIEVVNQFQAIKLLPPRNPAEIDSTIKLIQDKINFYSNPTEEEKTAFKEKAAREFDERNGNRDSKKQGAYKEKQDHHTGPEQEEPKKQKKHQHRQKKEINEKDFPGLA